MGYYGPATLDLHQRNKELQSPKPKTQQGKLYGPSPTHLGPWPNSQDKSKFGIDPKRYIDIIKLVQLIR
jgi:hypothetical protein